MLIIAFFFSSFQYLQIKSNDLELLSFWLLLTGFKIVRVLGVNIILLKDWFHVFLFVFFDRCQCRET